MLQTQIVPKGLALTLSLLKQFIIAADHSDTRPVPNSSQPVPSDHVISEFESRRKYLVTPGLERLLTISVETGARYVTRAVRHFESSELPPEQPSPDDVPINETTDPNFSIISDQIFRTSLELLLLGYYGNPSVLLNESLINSSTLQVQFPLLQLPPNSDVPIRLLGPVHQLGRLAFSDEFPLSLRLSVVDTVECVCRCIRVGCYVIIEYSSVIFASLVFLFYTLTILRP